jgi:hypothetical protein
MTNMSKAPIVEKVTEEQLIEELLLRSVVDSEFRDEYTRDTEVPTLPSPVAPQDMSFTEVVKDSVSAADCRSTCLSGFTLVCDGNTIPSDCRSTCVSGYTIRCDGSTL